MGDVAQDQPRGPLDVRRRFGQTGREGSRLGEGEGRGDELWSGEQSSGDTGRERGADGPRSERLREPEGCRQQLERRVMFRRAMTI